ncbi:MAG: inositol monophosphatase family protein [Acidilobaceae archaeon]
MVYEQEAEELRKIAVKVAGEAAALLRDCACNEAYTIKVQGETIVADKVSEDYVIEALRREGLKLEGISEERGRFKINGGGYLKVAIDPLDGSNNYSLCVPWASVSIAFAYGNRLRDVVAGAVAPIFQTSPFSFATGRGCFYGGKRVSRSDIKLERGEKIIVIYFDEERSEVAIKTLNTLKKSIGSLKVRSLGSAALEICYVALGKFVAFVDLRNRLRNVDVAAALGFLRELSGEAFSLSGEPVDSPLEDVVKLNEVVASSDPKIALKIVKLVV